MPLRRCAKLARRCVRASPALEFHPGPDPQPPCRTDDPRPSAAPARRFHESSREDRIMAASCSVQTLRALQGAPFPPTIIDVRRRSAFERDPVRVPMSLRRDPEAIDTWLSGIEAWRPVIVYCVRGHDVGQAAAARLVAHGLDARYLEGGLEAWRAAAGPVEPWTPPTKWVTRDRPKIDRIACPWLIRRFIDASAEIFYAPRADVMAFAGWHD